MLIKSNYTKRKLFYVSNMENWEPVFPNDKWCLLLISNSNEKAELMNIIEKAIDHNVSHISGIGKDGDFIDSYADEDYVSREFGDRGKTKPKYFVISTWHDDLEEGLWYGLNLTSQDAETIVILDADDEHKETVLDLISRFEEGYLPKG